MRSGYIRQQGGRSAPAAGAPRTHARPTRNVAYRFFDKIAELRDPVRGEQLLAMQEPQIVFRTASRGAARIVQDGGLPARLAAEEIAKIRQSRIEEYQDFNLNPFGYGTCNDIKQLQDFETNNSSCMTQQTLHTMITRVVSLAEFKIKYGMEPSPRDHEGEQIVLERVDLRNFLACIAPEFKPKFWSGGLVPNQLSVVEPTLRLPKHLRIDDLCSEQNILRWLLTNDAQDAFERVCHEMYTDINRTRLLKRLGGSEVLADAVLSASTNTNSEGIKPIF